MLDGAARVGDLVETVRSLGQTAVSITDHGNLFGVFEFYTACVDAGIKPIIGIEAYVAPGDATDRERVEWGELEDKTRPGAYTHLTVIAQNATGVRNLYRLHRESYTRGFYHKPRFD